MSEPIQAFNDAKWLFHFSRWAIEQILDFVKPAKDAQIMIFGPAGSGKTTVMSEALGVSLKEIVPTLSVDTFKSQDGLMIVDTPGDVDSIRDIISFLQKVNDGKKILLIYVGAGGFRLQKQQGETDATRSNMVSQASGEVPYRDAGVNRKYFERQMERELEYFKVVFELGILDHSMVSGLVVIANKRDYWEANFGSTYFDENYGPGSEI